MANKKMDRRAQKTERLIKAAFYDLLQQYRLKDITVKMICDEADIERKTFYLHYEDKYVLTDALLKDYLHHLHTLIIESSSNQDFTSKTNIALTFFDKNRDFFKRLFEGRGSYSLRHRLNVLLFKRLQQIYDFDDDQATLYFIVSGAVGTLELYIRGILTGNTRDIAKKMSHMIGCLLHDKKQRNATKYLNINDK